MKSQKPIYLWKSLQKNCVSKHNNFKWELNKWYKIKEDIKICHNGFHASKNIINAMEYVNCEILAKVEVRGKSIIEDDKQCWSEMRIIQKWKWAKKDSIKLAIYSANLVLENFEKRYPEDKRPRCAIDAAQNYLVASSAADSTASAAARSAVRSVDAARSAMSAIRSTHSVMSAARSAHSVMSAMSAAESAADSAAESAADSAALAAHITASAVAAESAYSAAELAMSAARSAAYSADSAADSASYSAMSASYSSYSAYSAAYSAARSARSAAYLKYHKWVISYLSNK